MATPHHCGTIPYRLSRRSLLQGTLLGLGTAALAACSSPAPSAPATSAPASSSSAPSTPVSSSSAAPTAASAAGHAAAGATIVYANYSSGADRQMWETIGGNFHGKFGNLTVKYNPIAGDTWGQYFDKLATLIAGGSPPDVARVAIEGALLFVAKGLAMPYDDMMKGDSEIDEFKKDCNQRLLDTFIIGGKTYAFPYDWNNMVVFYNVNHLKEAGLSEPRPDWTYTDFLEMAKKLTKGSAGGGDPERYGFGFAVQYFAAAMPWIFNAGSNLLSDDWAKSNASDPKLIEAVTFMHDLIWTHKVSPKPPSNNNDNQALFASGKVSMMGGGRWPVLFLDQQKMRDEYNVQVWPKWRDQVTEFGVGGFPILKETKQKDAAWQWVKYLIDKEPFEYMASLGQSIPARRSVAYDEKVMAKLPPKNWKVYYDSIEATNARPVPAPPEYNVVESTFLRYLGTVFANEQAPQAAMEAANKELTDLFAKRPKEWNIKSALLK